MTGGLVLVLGSTGFNLGAGMTGGVVYLLDGDPEMLNRDYVAAHPLSDDDVTRVRALLEEHVAETGSSAAERLLNPFDASRFVRVVTRLAAEPLDLPASEPQAAAP